MLIILIVGFCPYLCVKVVNLFAIATEILIGQINVYTIIWT